MKKLIILPFLLINIIQIISFAECRSPIKDTILTINAISQILGYSPKDIIWHIKERIYQNKILTKRIKEKKCYNKRNH